MRRRNKDESDDVSKSIGVYEERFCEALRDHIDKTSNYGDGLRFSKNFGVSPQQWCNILAGRRAMTESWRREVARFFGLNYEEMVGIAPDKNKGLHQQVAEDLLFLRDAEPDIYKEVCERIIGKAAILRGKISLGLGSNSHDSRALDPHDIAGDPNLQKKVAEMLSLDLSPEKVVVPRQNLPN